MLPPRFYSRRNKMMEGDGEGDRKEGGDELNGKPSSTQLLCDYAQTYLCIAIVWINAQRSHCPLGGDGGPW